MKRNLGQTSGFTLVELLISAVIIGMMVGVLGLTITTSSGAYTQDFLNSHVDSIVRRTIDHATVELITADRSSVAIAPPAPFGATSIEYRRGMGFGGGLVTSPTRRLELQLMPGELDDGIDNDGNGLVDECRVVFTPDLDGAPGMTVTRANYVRELLEGELPNGIDDNGNGVADEGGLFITFDPATGLATVELTLERISTEGRFVTRTARTSVRVRND